jgi:DUF4097 and DUF4098 domain-containing protein YvlB
MSLDQLPEAPVIASRPYETQRQRVVPAYVRVIGIALAATIGLSTLGFILLGAVSFLHVHVNDSTSQSLTVSGTPRLAVQSDVVDLHVTSGAGNSVTVRTVRHASALTYDLAQRALRQMTAQVSQSGDDITLTTHLPSFNEGIVVTQISMSVYVTVPQTTNLDIHSDVGDVDVQGVTGTMTIAGKTSDIELTDTTLVGSSSLRADVGDIICFCTLADAASLQLITVTGDIRLSLPRATSASLTASTDTGTVRVASVWPISTTHTNVGAVANGNLNANPSGTITADSSVGDITIVSR